MQFSFVPKAEGSPLSSDDERHTATNNSTSNLIKFGFSTHLKTGWNIRRNVYVSKNSTSKKTVSVH